MKWVKSQTLRGFGWGRRHYEPTHQLDFNDIDMADAPYLLRLSTGREYFMADYSLPVLGQTSRRLHQ